VPSSKPREVIHRTYPVPIATKRRKPMTANPLKTKKPATRKKTKPKTDYELEVA
jgi:hypothetical protein